MAEIKVTREMVQELAETGAVQPPKEIWGNLDELYASMGRLSHRRFSIAYDFSEFAERPKGKALLPSAKEIIKLSGEDPATYDTARVMGFTTVEADFNWHIDPEESRGGFSILFVKNPDSRDRLLVGGRSRCRARDQEKTYSYKNGPIILTQRGFGTKMLQNGQPSGATWHTGQRKAPARFGVVDIIPEVPKRTNQF